MIEQERTQEVGEKALLQSDKRVDALRRYIIETAQQLEDEKLLKILCMRAKTLRNL